MFSESGVDPLIGAVKIIFKVLGLFAEDLCCQMRLLHRGHPVWVLADGVEEACDNVRDLHELAQEILLWNWELLMLKVLPENPQ